MRQAVPLSLLLRCGVGQVLPVHVLLAKLRLQLDRKALRWLYVPSFFWLSAEDWVLRLVPAIGMVAAAGALLGLPAGWSPLLLLLAQLCLLSLDTVFWMGFPWDCLLFEVGWIAPLLPTLPPIWSPATGLRLGGVCSAHPLVAWMLRWLLWRLMFGFGKLKFSGTDHTKDRCVRTVLPGALCLGFSLTLSRRRLYVRDFMIMQPIPTRLGWLVHHLPTFCHQFLLYGMFLVEIPLVSPVQIRVRKNKHN